MSDIRIRSALISVYHKEGLDAVIGELIAQGVTIYATGGTQQYAESLGAAVYSVEALTDYPSILDGRVKTLHPKVFGGILARREPAHIGELESYAIPAIDLVIVDLYPFEQTVRETSDEHTIIEKIDIGGISLIRAAAKNYRDVVVVPSRAQYAYIAGLLKKNQGYTSLDARRHLATQAFAVTAHYDRQIHAYFSKTGHNGMPFSLTDQDGRTLRYGENPHQHAVFYGDLDAIFDKLSGKELSFNNLTDINAAMALMRDFRDGEPTVAIIKHHNSCGVATRPTMRDAWQAALAGDPVSAFGGIIITNTEIDDATASEIDSIFYEVLIAPGFTEGAQNLLVKKKNRILLRIRQYPGQKEIFQSALNGVLRQDADLVVEQAEDLKNACERPATVEEIADLLFANICVKHLKSNAIALVKGRQLIGMGCGQTSRVDALRQSIDKALRMGFDVAGSVMASDAFFPFPDCVEIAYEAGVTAVIQPGGSVRDQESIDFCNAHGMAMVMTGYRHFKH